MEQISYLTVIFKTLPNWYCFLLRYYEQPFIETTGYLFQLVSVTVSTCRKAARNKRKHFSMDRKSFPSSGNKFFPKKWVSTNFSGFPLVEKILNKRKWFPQDRNPSPQYVMKNSFKIRLR